MKKLFLLTIFILIISFGKTVSAATPEDERKEKASELKEKIATKVSELRKKEKKVIYGTIQSVNKDTITISTKKDGDIEMTITNDTEINYLIYGKNKKIDFKKILNNQKIIAQGEYEQLTKTFTPTKITIKPEYATIKGIVTKTDVANYILTVKDQNNKTYQIEVETESIIKKLGDGKLTLIGFSKINVDDTIITQAVVINNNGNYTPIKLIILPKI